MFLRLPDRYLRALLFRGVVLWILTALLMLLSMGIIAAVSNIPPVRPSPAWTLVGTATLVLLDLRRRKELILLHNLGVRTVGAVMVGTVPAVAGELTALALLS